jgi:septal ring factor EnvC (AmiA/AmiB activator)
MTNRGYIASALCVCALLSGATSCTPASAAEAAPQQEVMVSVPLSRLTELQSLINRQEQRLNQLQELLSGQSSGLSQQQQQISQLRQELTTAKSSLTSSYKIIDEQNASLMSLSEELRQEQRRTRRIERQRLLWQAVAGGAVVYMVLKE